MPSTVIRNFAYDAEQRRLMIEFVTGRRYVYSGVPQKAAAAFQSATSKGRYFNLRIRDHYEFRELPGQSQD